MFGRYNFTDYELANQFFNNVDQIYNSKQSDFKKTGYKERNSFLKMDSDNKKQLSQYLNEKHNTEYDWSFEYFHSCVPLVLHTDYAIDKEGNYLVAGFIAPLEWNCKQPYTLNFDRLQVEPRKIMWKPDHNSKYPEPNLRYLDNTDEIIDYRTNKIPTPGIEQYIPKTCEMYEQMQDIEIHSAYKWEVGTYLLFDTRRWHSSSWFSRFNTFEESLIDYKRSIIGFAKHK